MCDLGVSRPVLSYDCEIHVPSLWRLLRLFVCLFVDKSGNIGQLFHLLGQALGPRGAAWVGVQVGVGAFPAPVPLLCPPVAVGLARQVAVRGEAAFSLGAMGCGFRVSWGDGKARGGER